jgi:hypothetical protein
VTSTHVSGHLADCAVLLSQPDTFRDRNDFGSKPDSIRPKTNPGLAMGYEYNAYDNDSNQSADSSPHLSVDSTA